ncbi:MAG: phosphoribosyl-AMP cyclohydrolase [Planctomycetota bacterium]
MRNVTAETIVCLRAPQSEANSGRPSAGPWKPLPRPVIFECFDGRKNLNLNASGRLNDSNTNAGPPATGQAVYYSRSRSQLWRKGQQSGNVQQVRAIYLDCDRDTILLKVRQVGDAACHEGYRSCFFRQVTPDGLEVIGQRVFDPREVYGEK